MTETSSEWAESGWTDDAWQGGTDWTQTGSVQFTCGTVSLGKALHLYTCALFQPRSEHRCQFSRNSWYSGKCLRPRSVPDFQGFYFFPKQKRKNLKENNRVIAKMYPFVHFQSAYARPMHGNPGRGLACTSTQICSTTNLCPCINYKPTITCWDLPIKIQFQTRWPHPDIYVTKETRLAPPEYETFSQWRDVMSQTSDNVRQAPFLPYNSDNYAHGPWQNRFGARTSKASAGSAGQRHA